MRLLVLCPHFAPDIAPTGEVMTSIGSELVARGPRAPRRHVAALVPAPRASSPAGTAARCATRTPTGGASPGSTRSRPTSATSPPGRLAFAGFTVLSTAVGLRPARCPARRRARHVAAAHPRPRRAGWPRGGRRRAVRVQHPGRVPRRRRRARARSPDAERDPRGVGGSSAATYRRADAVTVLSDDLRDNVRRQDPADRRADADDRVRVIPNFVDTDRIRPADRENGATAASSASSGRRVVMYAGNVGLLAVARPRAARPPARCADRPDVVLRDQRRRLGPRRRSRPRPPACGNVRFVDYPAHGAPARGAGRRPTSTSCPLRRGLARSSVPSKLYSILAAGRPVRGQRRRGHRGGPDGRAGRGGPRGPARRSRRVHRGRRPRCSTTRPGPRRWARAGRRFVERWASPAAVAERYEAAVPGAARPPLVRPTGRAGPVRSSVRGHDTV